MGRAQHDAGILKDNKLSQEAKNRIFKNVKDELVNGSSGLGFKFFSCGPNTQPVLGAENINLEDQSIYGDFHKNVLGLYEKIVQVLDVNGQFMFPPIVVDPIALALAIDPPQIPQLKFPDEFLIFGLGLPLIATKLGFPMPIDLAAKLPSIIVPQPPNLQFPNLDIDISKFLDLFKFSQFQIKLPGLILDLATKIPTMFPKLLAFQFDEVCNAVMESQLFGPSDPRSTIQIIVAKNLSQAIAESIIIAVVAITLGSASGGIVGGLGRKFGYVPPAPEKSKTLPIRTKVMNSANAIAGASWSADRDRLNGSSGDFKNAGIKYSTYCFPITSANGEQRDVQKAFDKARTISSGLPLVRSAFMAGGASDSFFVKEESSQSSLISIASQKQALISFDANTAPSLKEGDSVLTTQSSFIAKNYFGGGFNRSFNVVMGGAQDIGNASQPTSIINTQVSFFNVSGSLVIGQTAELASRIVAILDCEKLIKT